MDLGWGHVDLGWGQARHVAGDWAQSDRNHAVW